MIEDHDIFLQGSKVIVRQFTESDISETYINWLNNPTLVRYSRQRHHIHTALSSLNYLHSFNNSPNKFFSVLDRNTSKQVGTMTVYFEKYDGTADLGILIGESGKGYGLEAWTLVLEWLSCLGQVRKITGGTVSKNIPMVNIMKRSGMAYEATRYQQVLIDGSPEDIVYYATFPN